jgi:hypothetical protein
MPRTGVVEVLHHGRLDPRRFHLVAADHPRGVPLRDEF